MQVYETSNIETGQRRPAEESGPDQTRPDEKRQASGRTDGHNKEMIVVGPRCATWYIVLLRLRCSQCAPPSITSTRTPARSQSAQNPEPVQHSLCSNMVVVDRPLGYWRKWAQMQTRKQKSVSRVSSRSAKALVALNEMASKSKPVPQPHAAPFVRVSYAESANS